jgi:hypothetical protein
MTLFVSRDLELGKLKELARLLRRTAEAQCTMRDSDVDD